MPQHQQYYRQQHHHQQSTNTSVFQERIRTAITTFNTPPPNLTAQQLNRASPQQSAAYDIGKLHPTSECTWQLSESALLLRRRLTKSSNSQSTLDGRSCDSCLDPVMMRTSYDATTFAILEEEHVADDPFVPDTQCSSHQVVKSVASGSPSRRRSVNIRQRCKLRRPSALANPALLETMSTTL